MLLAFVLYMAATIGLAGRYSRGERTHKDFVLGGGRFGNLGRLKAQGPRRTIPERSVGTARARPVDGEGRVPSMSPGG